MIKFFNMSKPLDLAATHQIKTLLLSQTVDNTALAVELIAKSKLNKILLSYLTAIALKHPNWTIRERAITVLQQHAPPKLQIHLQPYLGNFYTNPYFETNELYLHSSIYFFDAVLAEKMIFWHHQSRKTNTEHPVIRLHYQKWQKQHERISEIPFVDTIVIHKVQKFDFKHFMQSIEPMKVQYLHFYLLKDCITPIDMSVLGRLTTLTTLLFDGLSSTPVLNMPKVLLAPLTLLSIRKCKINQLEHLAPYLGQFKHLLIE